MPTDSKASRPCDGTSHRVTPTLGRRHWRAFPGHGQELAQVRRWLSSILPPCSARDDVLSVATELCTNAVEHTASGRTGGSFAVEVNWDQSLVHVAVADGGSLGEPRLIEDPDGERGRGLLLVRGLSARTGWAGDQRGRVVWAQIAWPDDTCVILGATRELGQTAVRESETVLAQVFAEIDAALVVPGFALGNAVPSRRALMAAPGGQDRAQDGEAGPC